MFDKNLILKQLQEMSSEEVASIVQSALIESEVEFCQGDTGIIFERLTSWDHCLFKFSTNSELSSDRNIRVGYYPSDIKAERGTMFCAKFSGRPADFGVDESVLVAAA